MTDNPLASVTHYSQFLAELLNRPDVERSTITVWSVSPFTGVAEGELFFVNGFRSNIKRNRIPAPGISFKRPNLPAIIQELEELIADVKGNKS